MSHQPGEAKGRPQSSFFKRKLVALFTAAAAILPIGSAFANDIMPPKDHESRYAGELVIAPPHSARTDTPLVIKPSGTALSRRLEALQQRFGNMMPDVKIVVMDKDWFQQNSILNGTTSYLSDLSDEHKATVRRLTSDYVRQRVDISFKPEAFEGLEEDALSTEGMALKFQYGETEEASKTSGKNICLLFPHFADKSRDQYYDSLIDRDPGVNGALADAPLRNPADYEYMKRFVDYHEIGHCYDRWYIKNLATADTPQAFLENRHKAETFGEVFANLMLARDGYTQFSESQADLRLAIAAFGGPASAHYGNPQSVSYYMTYAYLLHEGSRNAGREIERLGLERIQNMSMEEVINLAHDITERSTFDVNTVPIALSFMMANRYDLSGMDAPRQADPEAQRAYEIMQRLKADMEGAVRRVFDFGNRTEPVLQPSSFNFNAPSTRYMTKVELEDRARVLGRELRESLGWFPSQDNLARAYQNKKDALRRVLETGDAGTQAAAARDLALMHLALKNAYEALPQLQQQRLDFSIKWQSPLLKPAA